MTLWTCGMKRNKCVKICGLETFSSSRVQGISSVRNSAGNFLLSHFRAFVEIAMKLRGTSRNSETRTYTEFRRCPQNSAVFPVRNSDFVSSAVFDPVFIKFVFLQNMFFFSYKIP
jgi:hypothetical protein